MVRSSTRPTAIAWQFEPKSVLRAGFGVFSDILPGAIADVVGVNPPYVQTFQGGLLGTVGGTAIAPGVPSSAIDATAGRESNVQFWICAGSAFLRLCSVEPRNLSSARRYHGGARWKTSRALLHGVESCPGTSVWIDSEHPRAIRWHPCRQPAVSYTSERLSNGLCGLFCAVSLCAIDGSPIRRSNAILHRREQSLPRLANQYNEAPRPRIYGTTELHVEPLHGHRLQWRIPAILCGRNPIPLPGDLARDYGSCDYDIRNNLNAQYVYQLRLKFKNRSLAYALNGWQVSGTVFWHSGIPFSVLSTPYSANGNGIVNGSGPQFASVIPGVPLYEHKPIPGVTQPGTMQWLNPNAFVSTVDPSTGACYGGDSPKTCQFGNLGRNALRGPNFAWSDFYLTKWFPLTERVKLRFDAQFFNVFNHPNFGLPSIVLAGIPGKPSTQTGFGALTYTTSPPTGLLGVGLGGDSTPRMIAFQLRLEF